jgi:uncharacterized protein
MTNSIRLGIVLLAAVLMGACSRPAEKPGNVGATIEGYIPVPNLEGWVNDTADVLSIDDQECLSKLLRDYEHETKHQIAVLIVPTLGGEAIDRFCLRTANTWHMGRKGINDRILVCLAMKEKQVRIELGLGMERYISNAEAMEIIVTEMTPWFAKRDYAGGLERGLKRLMEEGRRFTATISVLRVDATSKETVLVLGGRIVEAQDG